MVGMSKCHANNNKCPRPAHTNGLCRPHYRSSLQGISADYRVQVRRKPGEDLTIWFWGQVEKTSTCWHWVGGSNGNGYGRFKLDNGSNCYPHRYSYRLAHGEIPDGLVVHHICHQRSCVNPSHLLAVTHKQNVEEPETLRSDNTSGYRGVSWDSKNKVWIAGIRNHGKSSYLGSFPHALDAAICACKARLEVFTTNESDKALLVELLALQ